MIIKQQSPRDFHLFIARNFDISRHFRCDLRKEKNVK